MKCKQSFAMGYYCCLATIIAGHGYNTDEADALRCIGKPTKATCDEYDMNILKESGILKEVFPRKKKTKK